MNYQKFLPMNLVIQEVYGGIEFNKHISNLMFTSYKLKKLLNGTNLSLSISKKRIILIKNNSHGGHNEPDCS
jgi:hypothetical protein